MKILSLAGENLASLTGAFTIDFAGGALGAAGLFAITGNTGAGKSTLLALLPRFYDATAGEVMVDGVNVRNLPMEEVYQKIGFVPQKGMLFSGTVRSNIAYGAPKATLAQIKHAAKSPRPKTS